MAAKHEDDGYWGGYPSYLMKEEDSGPHPRSFCYQQAVVKRKSCIAAGLLAIFFGCFGIHKFYLGYNSAGIVMLAVTVVGSLFSLGLAGVVMSVVSLIEGVIYLVMGQASFARTYVTNKKEWF